VHTLLWDHWAQTVESTLGSFARLTEMAGEALDNALNHHFDTLEQLLDAGWRHTNLALGLLDEPQVDLGDDASLVALVTGGTGGIGSEICRALSNAGNRVVATYPPAEHEQAQAWQRAMRNEGFKVEIAECDVTSFQACARMVGDVGRRVGPIAILVNGAGITRDATLRKMDHEQWDAVLDTNLDSVFNVTRNVVDQMAERHFGRIINISSVNGQKGQFGQTNYSAAKAGMIGFTRALARELAPDNITVNTISPGYVATRMVMAIPEEIRNGIVANIPLGRLAEPYEIARAVAFLAAETNGYITGSDIPVNGGLYMA